MPLQNTPQLVSEIFHRSMPSPFNSRRPLVYCTCKRLVLPINYPLACMFYGIDLAYRFTQYPATISLCESRMTLWTSDIGCDENHPRFDGVRL